MKGILIDGLIVGGLIGWLAPETLHFPRLQVAAFRFGFSSALCTPHPESAVSFVLGQFFDDNPAPEAIPRYNL
jgi:hypothetical protein